MNKVVELVRDLTLLNGTSGYEHNVRSYIIDNYAKYADSYSVDKSGNLVLDFKSKEKDAKNIVFAAHMDEVGFMVFDINEQGFLYLQPIGGWNTVTLASSAINIINDNGENIFGVIGQISPHFLKKGEVQGLPTFDTLFVDIGARSREEVHEKFKIHAGSIALPRSEFVYQEKTNRAFCKGFDDRIGCAAQCLIASKIDRAKLKWNVSLAFSVQEEVGHRGAEVLKNYMDVDAAIIIEGAPADDIPSGPSRPQTVLGNGSHARLYDPTHIANPALIAYVKDVSVKNKVRVQYAVRKGGGTDAASLALAFKGIPSIITGIPTRYAHSHISSIAIDDLEENVKLCMSLIQSGNFKC